MLLIRCPYCEEDRPEVEFHYAGEAHIIRSNDPTRESDAAWADYLYFRTNSRGWHRERWYHLHGCGRYFNAVRHTVTDRIATTYKAGEAPAVLPDTSAEGQS
ncbi:MAG: sarcosine oxidase subunit delta [Hyphomicrobiaceae bacterium]